MTASSDNYATDSNDASHIKELYQELAEKDKALIMAAEYGKNLVDEKEELERQIESLKRDHQNEIENLEQELYKLKRLLESMRNEYDNKIYELNEDINILNRRLMQKDQSNQSKYRRSAADEDDEDFEDVDELREKNKKILSELKSNEMKLSMVHENCQLLETKLADKENIISENGKMMSTFQKEINKCLGKQQELEFVLMQTCSERDKQAKIIEELTQKFLNSENEKHEIEHWAYQQETEMINLQRINQDLLYKLNYNTNSASKAEPSTGGNRKRRSLSNTPSSSLHMTLFSTRAPDSATNTPNFGQSFSAKKNAFSDQFGNRSYFDAEFDDIEETNDSEMFRINEIEQDDDDEIVYLKNGFMDDENDESIDVGGVNWLTEAQEANEQRLIDDDNSVGESGDDKEQDSHEEESTQESTTSMPSQQPPAEQAQQQQQQESSSSQNENASSQEYSADKGQEMN